MHRLFLKLMLWLLAASAAAGVLAVFLSTRVMTRVAGTALVGAVATALAMAVSRMLDDDLKRVGGLVGLGTIVVSFVLALASIWIEVIAGGWDRGWRLALCAVLACVGGLVAARLLAAFTARWARFAAPLALAADAVSCGFLIAAIWLDAGGELAATGLFALASGATAAAAMVGLGVERRAWRWIGVAAAVFALILGITGTWFIKVGDPTLYITSMSVAIAVGHAVIALRVPLADGAGWAKVIAIGATAAAGACLSALAFITEGFDQAAPEFMTRLAGALGIISACATVAIVVLYRLHRRPVSVTPEVQAIERVQLTCPHCGRANAAPIGESACPGCGLLIAVAVRAPRCAKCDYPLLNLRTPVCPECGTAAAAAASGP